MYMYLIKFITKISVWIIIISLKQLNEMHSIRCINVQKTKKYAPISSHMNTYIMK